MGKQVKLYRILLDTFAFDTFFLKLNFEGQSFSAFFYFIQDLTMKR